jgi:hypothetical protein
MDPFHGPIRRLRPSGWDLRQGQYRLAVRERPDAGMAEDEEPELSAQLDCNLRDRLRRRLGS